MDNIQQIIHELKNSPKKWSGEKTLGDEHNFLINRWYLSYEENAFVYEHIYFINHNGVSEEGAEQETLVRLLLTEDELLELFAQQGQRYFFNASVQ